MKIKDFEKLFNDVKEEYKIDSDLNIWVGDNPLKRPLLYGIKEVVPVFQKAEYSFSNYEQEVIEKLTGNSSNNYFCFFNKTKIDRNNFL